MPESRFDFRYTLRDVTSAQRLRFLRSGQLKILGGFGIASILLLSIPQLLPGVFAFGKSYSWGLVLEVALTYIVTLAVLFLVTPYADFFFNRSWHLPLTLQFNEKYISLRVTGGKSQGLRLDWGQILRVDENRRVFILHYGGGGRFVILPRSVFSRPADDRRFRDLLARRASLPAEGAGPVTPER